MPRKNTTGNPSTSSHINSHSASAESGVSLAKKLGVKTEGMPMAILWAPDGFAERLGLQEGAYETDLIMGKHDLIIIFTASRVVLREFFPLALQRMEPNAGIWIAWPRKSVGQKTDLSLELVRNIAQSLDMIELKRCTIEEQWNAVKFRKGTIDAKSMNGMDSIAPYSISTFSSIPITPDAPRESV